jgi:hypothetical protein
MSETIKAYIQEDWQYDALLIHVREGEGRTQRVGVIATDPIRHDQAPMLRRVPLGDLVTDDGAVRRDDAPMPGVRIPMAYAEAILAALLAFTSSTPGDNPVERARDLEVQAGEMAARIQELDYELAVAQGERTTWEGLALEKDERILDLKDRVADLQDMVDREREWSEALAHPTIVVQPDRVTLAP